MSLGDTSKSQVRYLKEVTWGVTPASAMKNMRFTGESLKFRIDTTKSNEIRSDRQITDNVAVGAGAEGGINFELSFGAIDDLLEGVLQKAWSTAVNMSGITFAAVATGNKFTDTGNGFVAAGIVAGQWIKVAGFTPAANNGFFRVESVAAGEIVVSGGTLVSEVAGDTVTIKGQHIHNSNVAASFTLEKEFSDLTQFISYTGMRVGDFSLEFATAAIVTGAISFMGKSGAIAGVTVGTGNPIAAPTADVMNAVSNVLGIFEGATLAELTSKMSKLGISVKNSLRGQNAIGTLGNVGIGTGRCDVSGTLSAYFENDTLYAKFLANTTTGLAWRAQDAVGNAYIISVPKVKLSDGTVVAGGADQDVMADFSWQAVMHATFGFTISIDKFAAA